MNDEKNYRSCVLKPPAVSLSTLRRVRNCTFLVANVTKNLCWWPDFHNWSPAGNWLFQAKIKFYTISLIFRQFDSSKIKSCPPPGHLFYLLLLLKYKTDFPLIIICHNISQLRSVLSFRTCTVVAWCEQHGDPQIVLTRSFWAKNQTTVFLSATRDGMKLTWKIWQSHETAYMASVRFIWLGFQW